MALKNCPKGGPLTLTLKAQAAKTDKGPRFGKFYASDNAFFSIAGAGERVLGVVPGAAAVNEPVTIQLAPATALVEAGGTVTADTQVMSDAGGKAVTATVGSKYVAGYAITGGAAGELITVLLIPPGIVTAAS